MEVKKLFLRLCFFIVFIVLAQACSVESTSVPEVDVKNESEEVNPRKEVSSESIVESLTMSGAEKSMLMDLIEEGPVFDRSKVLVSVINSGAKPITTNSWTQVDLCTHKGCTPLSIGELPPEVITPRTDGEAHHLGSIDVESSLLTEVKLTMSDDMGRPIVKTARLKEPLFLQYLAEKARLLIALKGEDACETSDCMVITSVTAVPESSGAKYLYFNPFSGSAKDVDQNVSVLIPEKALSYAQVFMVGVDHESKRHPVVDMFPRPVLDRPLVVTVSDSLGKGGASSKGFGQDKREYKIKDLEVIDRLGGEGVRVNSHGVATKAIFNYYDCIKALKGFLVQAGLNAGLLTKGYYYDNGTCKDVGPGIHIAVADSSYHDIYYDVMFSIHKVRAPLVTHLNLRRVTDYGGLKIAINGFTWMKDKGWRFQDKSMGVARGM